MKKTALSVLVASALVLPLTSYADATLYGSMRIKVQNLEGQGLNVADNTSRIGIKGSSELFNSAKAIFQFEQGISTETGALAKGRLGSIGIKGDFGTFNFGKQWTSFAAWTILPLHKVDNSSGVATAGYAAKYTREALITYVSPKLNGFQVAASVSADGNANGEDVDTYNISARYAVGGMTLAASTISFQDINENVSAITASYKTGPLYIAGRVAEDKRNLGKENSYVLTGTYKIGNTLLAANYGDDDNETFEEWSLEVRQQLGKRARVFAAYTDFGNTNGIEVGYRVDF